MTWLQQREQELPPELAAWAREISKAIHRKFCMARWAKLNPKKKRASEKAYRHRNREFSNKSRAAKNRRAYQRKKGNSNATSAV